MILALSLLLWGGSDVAAQQPTVVGNPSGELIVLTFDDGPNLAVLPQLLDYLEREHLRATFFFVGFRFNDPNEEVREARRALLTLTLKDGHEIGNHTYGHGALCSQMPEKMRNQKDVHCIKTKEEYLRKVDQGSLTLKKLADYWPIFFRPPHWIIAEKYPEAWDMTDPRVRDLCGEYWESEKARGRARKEGKKLPASLFPADKVYKEEINCRGYLVQVRDYASLQAPFRRVRDIDTGDWALHEAWKKNPKSTARMLTTSIEKQVMQRIKAGVHVHILTFHELPVSFDALKILVPEWRAQGFHIVTLREVYGL